MQPAPTHNAVAQRIAAPPKSRSGQPRTASATGRPVRAGRDRGRAFQMWGALVIALGGLLAAQPAFGAVSSDLRARMAGVAPNERLPVIVTLARQIDPNRYSGRPGALIRAERALSDATQRPVIRIAGLPTRRFWISNAVALSAPPATIARLDRLPAVANVDVDPRVRAGDSGPLLSAPVPRTEAVIGSVQSVNSDASPGAGDTAPLDAIGARAVWGSFGVTGAGIRLGSIDTGVDPANADLAGKIVGWHDFVGGQPTPYDDNGHGTHTIGTMVGGSAQGAPIGVAPGARVIVAKAMGADGGGLGSNLLAAAQWMLDPDGNPATNDFPAAIDNSWTADDANDTWFDQVVRTWLAAGIVPVFAAGNSGPAPSTIGSPGSYPSSLAVAAVDDTRTVASFSARGPVVWQDADATGPAAGTVLAKPDLSAPGVGIVSTVGTGYLSYSGTSMAAPHVAGVAALVKQANPGLSAEQIEQLLRQTATDLGPPGQDPDYGAGLVNALAAVSAALGRSAPAAAPPVATPAPAAAPSGPVLRDVHVVMRTGRGRRSLTIRGRLLRPARLRAVLTPGVRSARVQAAATPASARSAPAGPFQLVLSLAGARPGRYRLVLTASDAADRPLGSALTKTVAVPR